MITRTASLTHHAIWALLAGVVLLLLAGVAQAEGSRNLYPLGYVGSRANLDLQPGLPTYVGVVKRETFLYAYAETGEYLLLGSRNRSNNGDVLVYDPQSFGAPGNETVPAAASFTCSVGPATGNTAPGPHYFGGGRGVIATRAQELGGPNSADGTATLPDGYAPCGYRVPRTGIYGVRFTPANTGGGPNGDIGTPALSNNSASAWDVTVRANASSVADINTRVFTYAFAGFTGANSRQLNSTLYYITRDGYRYEQILRGLDPNGYALYANTAGFLDTGSPLYKDIRGSSAQVTDLPAGVTAQPARYPIFFSNVAPAGPNAAELGRVLAALGIPAVPPLPQLSNVSFVGNVSGNTSVVNAGGVFRFDTVNTITYEIVISRDGVDFNPANTANRVLTGIALTGSHNSIWNGTDNSGVPFPVGTYPFQITGRNGEAHFPIVDAEGNGQGGPTLRKLNGSIANATRVYYDDRGYVTRSGQNIGTPNGFLCGAALPTQPTPVESLLGIDSDLVTAGLRYRNWPGNGNTNTDCGTTAGFGDAKALDLWAFESTPRIELPLVIVPPPNGADVGTAVAVDNAAFPGQTVYGTFNFRNDGDVAATGVTYRATVGTPGNCPASLSFSLLPPGVTATYNPATCEVAFGGMPTSLTPGQELTFNFNYPAPAPGTVVVATEIGANNEGPNATSPNTASGATVIRQADVAVDVTVPPVATPGSTVSGTVNFSNLSAATATAAGVTYTLTIGTPGACPAGVVFPGLPPGIAATYDPVSCQVVLSGAPTSLAPGAGFTINFEYIAPPSGSIPVVATINTTTPEAGTANNTDSGVTAVTPTADLAIVKTGPASVAPGGPIVYLLTVTNYGPGAANGATVSDPLPAGVSGVAAVCGSPTGGAACGSFSVTGTSVAGTIATFPAGGSVTITITATAPTVSQTLTNAAAVAPPPGVVDPNLSNNSSSVPTGIPAPVPVADLAIVKSGPASVAAGATITYTLAISNNGPDPADGATFSDPVPAAITGVNAVCGSPAGGAACGTVNLAGNLVTGTIAALPSGGSVLITITGTAPLAATLLVNTAIVAPPIDVNDSNPNNNTSTVTTSVPPSAVDLAIVKTGPASVGLGAGITYTLTVTNNGPAAADGATVNDPVPAAISGVSASCTSATGGAVCGTVDVAGNAVSAIVATFPSGGQVVLTINGTAPNTPQTVVNTATVAPPPGTIDNNPANNSSSVSTNIPNPLADLAISKSGPASVAAGGPLTYVLTITNLGPAAANGATFVDAVPAGVTGVGGSCGNAAGGAVCGAVAVVGNTVTGTVTTLPSGGSVQITILGTAPATAQSIRNTATVAPPPGTVDPVTENNVSEVTTTVAEPPDLTIVKIANGSFTLGQVGATYTLTVSNVGTGPTTAPVNVTDTLAAGLTATAIAGSGWSCTLATLTCTRADVLAGGASYPPITLTVNVAANAPSSVVNTATVSGGGEINTGNNSSTVTTPVIGVPDLTVTKVANGTFTQGQVGASYTLTVSNVGSAPTTAPVSVTDSVPAGLTATALAGSGWTCTLATVTCTRADALAAGASYPPITLTVNVATAAASPAVNTANVSGGGEQNLANNSASVSTPLFPGGPPSGPSTSIPALSPLSLALLALMLAALGALGMRPGVRRRR